MIYYIKEKQIPESVQKTAGIKAREDLEAIFSSIGIRELPVPTFGIRREELGLFRKFTSHIKIAKTWESICKRLEQNDVVIIQFPIIEHTLFLLNVFRKLKSKNIKIVLFIHDLELIRRGENNTPFFMKTRINLEEKQCLQIADYIIGHNDRMNLYLNQIGISNEKLISLDIFDYIINNFEYNVEERIKLDEPIIIGGNLRKHKAGYVYNLPSKCDFNLYGVGYTENNKENIHYYGAFNPDEIPLVMKGSFGLVWDGMSPKSCEGVYGSYLKINNPHKTSLYIASGIPVLIWKEAALANFVVKKKIGIAIDSLKDIPYIIKQVSKSEYEQMIKNTIKEGERLRCGYYTKLALSKCGNLFSNLSNQ